MPAGRVFTPGGAQPNAGHPPLLVKTPQGVGVALFDSRAAAEAAVEALSGRQADGRRLDLLVMSPDNHISFSSCKVGNSVSLHASICEC